MYKILIKPIYKILIKPNSINQLGWMLHGYSSSEFWQKVLQDEDENGDLFGTEIAKFNLAFKAYIKKYDAVDPNTQDNICYKH